jgi:shikimate dehydrogenase
MTDGPRAFVIGHPIAHSRSPMLHGYWLKLYGIDGSYQRVDVAPVALADFFAGLREAGWAGGNVTVPHKAAAVPYLARVDAAAEAMGAVNTLWWEGEDLVGGNTDAAGFLGNLDEAAPGWGEDVRKAVILGAGGAARAAAWGLLARDVDVAVCNRSREKAEALAARFGPHVSGHGMGEVGGLLREADLLVNTTSLGMAGQPPLELDLGRTKLDAIVCDVVYVPLETGLLKQARSRGLRTVDGLGMLLHQAVDGFRHWFGRTPEVTPELRQLIAGDIRARTPGA